MKRLLFIVVLLIAINSRNLLVEGSPGILKATKLGITVRPGAPVYAAHETTSKTIHSLNLWDVVYVIDGSMEEARRLPVGSEHNRLYGYKVFLPFSPGKWGWVKYNHVRTMDISWCKGHIKNNNTPLYNGLPGGREIAGKAKNSTFIVREIHIQKKEDTFAQYLRIDILSVPTGDMDDQTRKGWIKHDDVLLSDHEAHAYTGLELLREWRENRGEHFIGGAEKLFKYLLKKYPDKIFTDRFVDSSCDRHTGVMALDELSNIYIAKKKYRQAINYLQQIIQQFPRVDSWMTRMHEWGARGLAGSIAKQKIADIYYKRLDDPEKAIQLQQTIIKEYPDKPIWGFEWNSTIDIQAIETIDNIGKEKKLPVERMLNEFQSAVKNSESNVIKVIGTIKQVKWLRKAHRPSEAVELLSNVIQQYPTTPMYYFKIEVDYSVCAFDLLCQVYSLDLGDPAKARTMCTQIYNQYKQQEDTQKMLLPEAALFLKAETLDHSTGNKNDVIKEYEHVIAQNKNWNLRSTVRRYKERQGFIGTWPAQERLKEIRSYETISTKADDEITLLMYPAPGAQVIKKLTRGTPINILYKKGDRWYKIASRQHQGTIGWAEKSSVEPPLSPVGNDTRWSTTGGNPQQWRSVKGTPIQSPVVKAVLENVATREIISRDVNKDGIQDLIIAGMEDRTVDTRPSTNLIMAINGKTETVIWKFAAKDSFSSNSPAIDNGILYCTSIFAVVYAIDVYSGDQLWTYQIRSGIQSSPVIDGNCVYVGSQLAELFILDKKSGGLIKKINLPGRIYVSTPAVKNNKLYCSGSSRMTSLSQKGFSRGLFFCVDLVNHTILWQFQTDAKYIKSSPAVTDDIMIAGADDGVLYALDPANGELKWKFKTNGPITTSPALRDNIVCTVSEDGHIYALEIDTGQLLWKFKSGGKFIASPCIVDNVVYAGSYDRHVYALKLDDGQMIWKYNLGSYIIDSISAIGPLIAVLSNYQKLSLIGQKLKAQEE